MQIQGLSTSQNQKLALNQYQRQSLSILSGSVLELSDLIRKLEEENPFLDVDWDNIPSIKDKKVSFESYTAAKEDPLMELMIQFHIAADPSLYGVGEYLIASLDRHGYLNCSLDQVAETLGIPVSAADSALNVIHTLEPPGVGARNLQESLCLQLERQTLPSQLAITIVRNHIELLAKKRYAEISELCAASYEEVLKAAELIKEMNPYPFQGMPAGDVQYAVPELLVSFENGEPVVRFMERIPSLQTYSVGVAMDSCAKKWIRGYLTEAQAFITAVEHRRQTLLQIGEEIVRSQRDFFETGAPLRPLTQREVAESLGFSTSTIGRAISDKYLQFDNSVYPLAFFFQPRTSTGASREEIKAIIRTLVTGEQSQHPVNDGQIARYLASVGQPIAKRTVTKYRQQMGIPSAAERMHTGESIGP